MVSIHISLAKETWYEHIEFFFPLCLVGSIDFTIATMAKSDYSSTDEVYIAGFVPSYLLPHKRSCSLDPFLHPLITEIEDIFISGEHMPI